MSLWQDTDHAAPIVKMKHEALFYYRPTANDGSRMWRLVRESGRLDLNSPYSYMMMGQWFGETCRLAEDRKSRRLAGMVTGFRLPSSPDTLFIWQIAVDPDFRGKGIGVALLDTLIRELEGIRYVEATISPSNAPSVGLFRNWAACSKAPIVVSPMFAEGHFPEVGHEEERLYRIGPLW